MVQNMNWVGINTQLHNSALECGANNKMNHFLHWQISKSGVLAIIISNTLIGKRVFTYCTQCDKTRWLVIQRKPSHDHRYSSNHKVFSSKPITAACFLESLLLELVTMPTSRTSWGTACQGESLVWLRLQCIKMCKAHWVPNMTFIGMNPFCAAWAHSSTLLIGSAASAASKIVSLVVFMLDNPSTTAASGDWTCHEQQIQGTQV